MGRSKINLEFIAKDSKRLATFKNRKETVFKKARELAMLCAVRLCVIIQSHDKPGYQVFPSEEEARELIHIFKNMPKKGKLAPTTTPEPEKMSREEALKAQEQIAKLQMENRELELEILMYQYITGALSMREIRSEEARGTLWVAQKRLRAVQARIDVLYPEANTVQNSPAPAIAAQPVKEIVEDTVDTELHL
ncbi:hypothetical protein LUZ61_012061 [Rhynchospora tenuis]|uniref:MADS-box domain-containing protein n=1 Tax=Rhynchospora tenuis TaxID=198213 RepID=A0AAD6F0U3_9POAL|nr:hypothetical protein LUZ61_012061 [Rhynchospora tenuis]